MRRNEQTSERMGRLAAKILRDHKRSKDERRLAASVLTQRPNKKKKDRKKRIKSS